MKKITFLSICILMVTNLFAADYYVKAGGSDTANGQTEATAWATLSKAHAVAADGDRIYIVGSISHTTQLTLTKALTFTGMSNAVITGGSSRMFVCSTASKPISFTGITFQNVNLTAATNGAVFAMNAASSLSFENCVFNNNKTIGQGGATEVTGGGSLTVTNCKFTNNVSTGNGGAINIIGTATNLTISGSTFTGNSTVSGTGGAINAIGTAAGVLSVTTSLFSGNNAGTGGNGTAAGGAIYVANNLRQALISYSTFYNNTSLLQGGAIFAAGTNATSKFTNITCFQNKTKLTTSTTDKGGAIRIEGERPFTIENSLVYGNSVAADGIPLASDLGVATTTVSGTSILTLTKSLFGVSAGLDAGDSYATSNIAANLTSSNLTWDGTIGKVTYGLPTAGDASPIDFGTDGNDVGAWDSGLTLLNTWTGAINTDWTNAGNWNNGVPTVTTDVTIGTGATFQPTIASNVSVASLTLDDTASLTVSSGYNLTVTGAVANSGTITLENNVNLIQEGTTNTNTGNVIVKRNSNPLYILDYTMWSSPVSGTQTLAQFSPLTSTTPFNRFYTYNPANNLYANVAPTTPFATGTGYLIRMPKSDATTNYNEGTAPLTYNGEFIGKPNNGTLTLSGLTADKFYSVGNPYPSTISADAFINGNSTGGTLYFWRKRNAQAGSAYATYNLVGTTVTASASTNGSTVVPNGIIQVGQGFIVKTGVAATSLAFTNAMRVANNDNQFFKTKQVQKDRVWLNLFRPLTKTGTIDIPEAFSQALIGYMDGATLDVDDGIDGKYINDSKVALTSSINDEEYTIQGRPAFDPTDVVALNFKTDADGDYTIALDHFDGVFAAGQDVYLVDSKTGTETDLKAGAYTFNAISGVDNTRFSLKFQKTLKVGTPDFNENSVSVYKNNGALYVNSGFVTMNNIKVFDIQGRLIAEQKNLKSTIAVFNNLRAKNQVLIVKIRGENNNVVSKKIVN